VLHPRALASMAECRTMPHSAELDCRVPRSPSRVRFAGLRPPLTAPTGRSSAHPTHSDFKRGHNMHILNSLKTKCGEGGILSAVVAGRLEMRGTTVWDRGGVARRSQCSYVDHLRSNPISRAARRRFRS